MSRQTEYDQESVLPQPELNPLLNPLLGQHMGRWAEVYFTAAPEHREEAVLALLRELESDTTDKPGDSVRRANFAAPDIAGDSVPQSPEFPPQDSARTSPKSGRLSIVPKSVICDSCGQTVPETQRFCGMCGAPMRGEAVVAGTVANQNDISHAEIAAEEFHPIEVDDLRKTVFSFGGNVAEQVSREPSPYRYRIYVGAALALLMVVLLIMAYRGTQDWSRSSHPLPQAAPSASPQPGAQPAAKPDTPAEGPVGEARLGHEDPGQAQADRQVEPKIESPKSSTPPAMPSRALPVTGDAASTARGLSSVAANQGNGAEELQLAERYLNGTGGTARDSSEAAKWLWQAVSKQNSAATLLLSDLYLRGDGVPKSCDQARLLLDAAGRKGVAGAGDRLRNLQAFGCQ